MIETSDPEINVVELMRRVRQTARRGAPDSPAATELAREAAGLPAPPPFPPLVAPTAAAAGGNEGDLRQQGINLLTRAAQKNAAGSSAPGFLRPLARNQGGFNGILLETVRHLLDLTVGLQEQVNGLRHQVSAQETWVHAAARVREEDGTRAEAWRSLVERVVSRLGEQEGALQTSGLELQTVRDLAQAAGTTAGEIQRQWPGWQNRVEDLGLEHDRVAAALRELSARDVQHGEWREIQTGEMRGLRDQTASLDLRTGDLAGQGETLRARLGHLEAQTTNHGERLQEVSAAAAQVREHGATLQDRVGELHHDLERHGEHLRHLQHHVDDQDGRTGELDGRLLRVTQQVDNLRARTDVAVDRSAAIQDDLERAGTHLRNLQAQVDGLEHGGHEQAERTAAAVEELTRYRRDLERLDERQVGDSSFLKAELALHRRPAPSLAHHEAAPGSDADGAENTAPAGAAGSHPGAHDLDAFYLAFENEFRGSREAIRERQRVYLPVLESTGAGHPERPLLDLGCGRGEWLELLQESGRTAVRGADLNVCMVDHCRERGLDVTLVDALTHLRALPDGSQGAVTGFHIIEHLPFPVLLDLLAETHRVLQPGGVAIFESPNCKNLVVGACNFYSDPTHRNPVFPDTARFMFLNQGFARAELRYLSAVEGSPFDLTRPEGPMLAGWFFGARDFAVIGHKAGA